MTNDRQAAIIKIAAIVTATPRWVTALLAAEGLSIPASWMGWWLPVSALFSVAMAIVEGLAFSFIFSTWRNQKDKSVSSRLLVLAIFAAVSFIAVLAPQIAASVKRVLLSEILANDFMLGLWSCSVAASTIAIVVSVGYAQKAVVSNVPNGSNAEVEVLKAKANEASKNASIAIENVRKELAEKESAIAQANARADRAERMLADIGDVAARLFGEEKKVRILTAFEQWPQLPASAIAVVSESSPSYVSEVLSEVKKERL